MNLHLIRTIGLGMAVAALGASTTTARAGFVPILSSPTPGAAATIFTYDLIFSSNGGFEQLADGNQLTLYDFGTGIDNLTSIVIASGEFNVTVQNLGITPIPGSGTIMPIDSAAIPNITFTYNGPTLSVDQTFVATITLNGVYTTRLGEYASQNKFPLAPGGTNTGTGVVFLPSAMPVPVPEPTNVMLMSCGLVVSLGAFARRRTLASEGRAIDARDAEKATEGR